MGGITESGEASNYATLLWHPKPAAPWIEALPVGNGRLVSATIRSLAGGPLRVQSGGRVINVYTHQGEVCRFGPDLDRL